MSAPQKIVCTIVTPDFIDRALAIFESVRRTNNSFEFCALVTGPFEQVDLGFSAISLDAVARTQSLAVAAERKYSASPDNLRWTLKPIFLLHLLDIYPLAKIIYTDADTCFFRDPSEIFIELDAILLTPHRRTMDPDSSIQEFRANFLDGIFNAGFIAATSRGIPALRWWAKVCINACEHNYGQGLFADQRYLDLLPVYFRGVSICKHRGYNVADWNRRDRTIKGQPRIGMIHFTSNTIRGIQDGDDDTLKPHFNQYTTLLENCRSRLKKIANLQLPTARETVTTADWDLQAAAALKVPSGTNLRLDNNAAAFLSRLRSACITSVVCDYDTVFGNHGSAPPTRPDAISVSKLMKIFRSNVMLLVTSHRGARVAMELRDAFPSDTHNRIWVSLYGGTLTCELAKFEKPGADNRGMMELWRQVHLQISDNLASVNTKLTEGGQLALRCHNSSTLGRLVEVARYEATRIGIPNLEVVCDHNRHTIYIVSGAKSVDELIASTGLGHNGSAVCLGTYGDELGTDYRLLRHRLSLSCGSVSLDLSTCWNLSPKSRTYRQIAYSYLDAFALLAGTLKFVG